MGKTRKRETGKEKKVYEKPQIIYQQSLEALAGACGDLGGKASGDLPACNAPLAS